MAVRKSVGKAGEGMFQTPAGVFVFSKRVPVTVDGKRKKVLRFIHCPGAKNITEAREIRKRIEGRDEIDIAAVDGKSTFHTLAVAAFAAKAKKWKGATVQVHEANLETYLAGLHDLKPSEINAIEFYRLVVRPMQKAKKQTRTIASVVQTANIVFAYAILASACTRNPIKDLDLDYREGEKSTYKPRVVTVEEFGWILAATKDNNHMKRFTALHYRVCFALFMFCGLRLGEAIGLQWGDIDWEQGRIHIRRQRLNNKTKTGEIFGPPKTLKSADWVTLPASLAVQLKALRAWAETADPTAFVLAGRDGALLGRTTVFNQLRTSCRRARLEGDLPSPHDLRHSFGSMMMAQVGVNPKVTIASVSRQMRHDNPKITLAIYTHEWNENEGASTVVDDLLGGAWGEAV